MSNPTARKLFFKNYDYIEDSTGPGEGFYQNMHKYKSVKDFFKKKRLRKKALNMLLKIANEDEQYKIDRTLESLPGDESSTINQTTGRTYLIAPNYDSEDKRPDQLLFPFIEQENPIADKPSDKFNFIINQEPGLYGDEREISREDLENEYTADLRYGVTDSMNETYKNVVF